MNMGCRIIWGHEMLKRAACHNLISPYQFGGQNGHMSISCILLKRTSYDIIRLMCLVAVIFDNDATAAYDRMIPSQCMITSRRAGVPESAIQMKLTVLRRMKYFVKTAYGNSSTYFMNTSLRTILGLLQGSSDVGPIWTLNSSVQFQMLDELHPPARFPSPCPHVYIERNAEGFVDDVSLWETSEDESIQIVATKMQEKAQTWERGVHVLGGALNLLKNFYFAVRWKYQANGQPVMSTIQDDPDIMIHLTQGANRSSPTPVPRTENTKGK
jgi:hypothetical protein